MSCIPIILLAAGQSTRMGGTDKLMQMVDGEPLIRRSARNACASGPVIAALPPGPHPRHDALAGLDIEIVEVFDAAEGMNASLRHAMSHVDDDAAAVMILLADLPDLTSADIKSVLGAMAKHPDMLIWRGATATGQPGHPVIFDCALFEPLKTLTGDTGAQSVVRTHSDRVHLHPLPGENSLLDLDTPDDWARWRKNQGG